MKKLIVEFIGTFFLVFTIGCSVASGTAVAPLAIGSALMIMVFAGGHISGAHYNPAVSLAVFIRGKMSAGEMVQYWVVQIIGGLCGALISYYITDNNAAAVAMDHGENTTHMIACLAEIIGTFALAWVVLNVATANGTAGNSFYGLAIGFTVMTMAFSLGGISGGAFNPAVGTGRVIASMITSGAPIEQLWIYIVGPFAGAGLAAIVFKMVNTEG